MGTQGFSIDLPQSNERHPQGDTITFSFPDNGIIVERSGWKMDLGK